METATPDARPEREPFASDVSLACPICRYDLRGLAEPRCPECGFTFTWAELRDARTGRHPYLFEHARRPWRRRAWVWTWWRSGLRPWRFWQDVSPTNPVGTRRLLVYWAVASAPAVLVAVAISLAAAVAHGERNALLRADYKPMVGRPGMFEFSNGPLSQAELDRRYPRPTAPVAFVRDQWREYTGSSQGAVMAAALTAAAWPWLTAAGLLVFHRSLRRAHAARGHVLRTAVYGGDVGLLAAAVVVVLYGPVAFVYPWVEAIWMFPAPLLFAPPAWCSASGLAGTHFGGLFDGSRFSMGFHGLLGVQGVPIVVLAVVPLAVATTLRTALAYGRYLRLARPLATAVAVQAMVATAVVVATIVVTRQF